jgi:hypothetical protein
VAVSAAALADTTELFNGQNLDGWYVVVGDKGRQEDQDIFTVEDGEIHAYADDEAGTEQPFAALVTEEKFKNYRLGLEFKWGEKKFRPRDNYVRDAGLLFHVHGRDEIWSNCVEYQIQEGDTADIWAIGTQVSSKRHPVEWNYNPGGELVTRGSREVRYNRLIRSHCWEVPGWNKVEVEVRGNNAVYRLNGRQVNEVINARQWDDGRKEYVPLEEGKIAVQAEGAEVFYRNIKLHSLED